MSKLLTAAELEEIKGLTCRIVIARDLAAGAIVSLLDHIDAINEQHKNAMSAAWDHAVSLKERAELAESTISDLREELKANGLALEQQSSRAEKAEAEIARRDAHGCIELKALRMALSKVGVSAPESDEELAARLYENISNLILQINEKKTAPPAVGNVPDELQLLADSVMEKLRGTVSKAEAEKLKYSWALIEAARADKANAMLATKEQI